MCIDKQEDYDFEYERHNTFMSNIKKEYMSLIFQAAHETGYNIFVKEEATDCYDNPLPNYIEVHTNETERAHTTFWNRYDELKNEVAEDEKAQR